MSTDPQGPCSVPRKGQPMPPCAPRDRRAQPHRVTAGAGCRQGPGPASLPGGVTGGHRARQGQGPTPPPPPAGPIRPGNGPSQEVPAAVGSTAPAPPPAAGPGPAAPCCRVPGCPFPLHPVPPRRGMLCPRMSVPQPSAPPPHGAAGRGAGARQDGGSAGWRRRARHAGSGSSPSRAEGGAMGRWGLQVPACRAALAGRGRCAGGAVRALRRSAGVGVAPQTGWDRGPPHGQRAGPGGSASSSPRGMSAETLS